MTDAHRFERPDSFSLLLNFLPILQLTCGMVFSWLAFSTPTARLMTLTLWVYLLPPLVSRLTLAAFGRPQGQCALDSRAYRVWWFLTQWQMLFNRLPWLEELLRLIPGLYAQWIWLWGGHLSPFAYVSPGVLITDRYLVDVARGAVLGMECRLAGHIAIRDGEGRFAVIIAAPVVEEASIVGGEAGLGPGARLRAGQMLPVGRRVAPFTEWPRRAPSA
ncbi:hypothetical protein [Niveibacterium sp. COAC-50]|uniref:hypothetical protein n=1 Tax=Niveibacterium sp. COAC-50 TaxID=2729384 RepID=UPI0015566199|nr:hypothetical protein [Niveibacterium sp. COAC-50]